MKQVSENSIDWSPFVAERIARLDAEIDCINYELEREHTLQPWVRDELIADRDHLTSLRDEAQNAIDALGLQ